MISFKNWKLIKDGEFIFDTLKQIKNEINYWERVRGESEVTWNYPSYTPPPPFSFFSFSFVCCPASRRPGLRFQLVFIFLERKTFNVSQIEAASHLASNQGELQVHSWVQDAHAQRACALQHAYAQWTERRLPAHICKALHTQPRTCI